MPKLSRLALSAVLAGALAGGLMTAATGTAAALPSGRQADFNGDGYPDLAVGNQYGDAGGETGAGSVALLYGSPDGISPAQRTVVHQNTPGVPGVAEFNDFFGSGLAFGDLDADGYTDLVVGAYGESVDGVATGSVTVLWGGPDGMDGAAVLSPPADPHNRHKAGRDLDADDLDGDGDIDVAVAGQTSYLYAGPFSRNGVPEGGTGEYVGTNSATVSGDLNGDGAAEPLFMVRADSDPRGTVEYLSWTGQEYARSVASYADGLQGAVGDIDGDGYGDLVLGDAMEPSADTSAGHVGGRISVWYGGPGGPDTSRGATVIHQATSGVPGGAEEGDRFGHSVSVGDANGDGYADVAVGAAGEDLGSEQEAGMVTVLHGSPSGLTTDGARAFTQNTAGVPGAAEQNDVFGDAVRLSDVTGDGRADLTVTATGENHVGGVWLLRGGAPGITTSDVDTVGAKELGLRYSVLGDELATAAAAPRTPAALADDFDGDGYRDTAIGAPRAGVGGAGWAGLVTVLYGSADGPSTRDRQTISQSTPGVPGGSEEGDQFGAAVASADLDEDGYADLIVGAPYEDLAGAEEEGRVTVVWGSPGGLSGGTVIPLTREELGYAGDGEHCRFGIDLAATSGAAYERPEVEIGSWCLPTALRGPFTRSGLFQESLPRDSIVGVEGVAAGDLNRDGGADSAQLTYHFSDGRHIYLNAGPVGERAEYHRLPEHGTNADFGDVNGDGHADLVVGDPENPDEYNPNGHPGGRVLIWLGSADGIDIDADPVALHQSTRGIPGAAETVDRFGGDVTVGDIDGDGIEDIVVGVPGEHLSGPRYTAGLITVVPGRAGGPDGTGAYSVSQSTAGVPGGAESDDAFGSSVRLADVDGDGFADLAVGVPGENRYEAGGGLWLFPGSAAGLDLESSSAVTAGDVGLAGEAWAEWGAELAP